MLTLLRKKTAAYVGRHADDDRAPTGTECVDCGLKQLGVPESMLARCSMCEVWRCSTCYSQHALTPPPVTSGTVKAPLWKRVIGRA
jgi:hypothetical protein